MRSRSGKRAVNRRVPSEDSVMALPCPCCHRVPAGPCMYAPPTPGKYAPLSRTLSTIRAPLQLPHLRNPPHTYGLYRSVPLRHPPICTLSRICVPSTPHVHSLYALSLSLVVLHSWPGAETPWVPLRPILTQTRPQRDSDPVTVFCQNDLSGQRLGEVD